MPISPKGYIHVLLVTKYNGVNPNDSETEMINILKNAQWNHNPLIRNVFTKTFQAVENASLNGMANTIVGELKIRRNSNLDVDIVMQIGNLGRSTLQIFDHTITSNPAYF